MILQSLIARPVDVVVTNSTPCMVAAAQKVKAIPVTFPVAFEPKQVGLKSIPANLSGLYDSLQAGEFADILVKCIPGKQSERHHDGRPGDRMKRGFSPSCHHC